MQDLILLPFVVNTSRALTPPHGEWYMCIGVQAEAVLTKRCLANLCRHELTCCDRVKQQLRSIQESLLAETKAESQFTHGHK